jgi:hypothetical protein
VRRLTKKLLEKSKSAFLLSLEVFNKPTIEYRTESFSILFTNAWELLLKAYLFQTSGGRKLSIFRRKRKNRKRESLKIDECLKKVFPNIHDPVRKNIEYISEVRNEAVHLIITELDPYFSRVFQRGVLNYFEYIEKWFSITLSEKLKPGFISLISDESALKDMSVLKERFSKEEFQSIILWIERFRELEKLGDKATIPISYSIAIVRNPKKADLVLSAGATGKKAIVLERYKDIDQTHPHRRKEAMQLIMKRLEKETRFTTYDFEAYCFVKGIKKASPNEYHWRPKYGNSQYSGKLIDEIVVFLNSNPLLLSKLRNQYSKHLKQRKKQKL